MTSLRAFLVLSAALIGFGYAGCTNDNNNDAGATTTTTTTVTGVGGGSPCSQGGEPNGTCIPSGPAAETCACPDCATAALCTDGCNDDGTCDFDGGEDCSCDDCFYKVEQCAPNADGCDSEEPGCQPGEACTCPDCTDTPFCTDNCTDNGVCVEWFEGCSCADCDCGGSGPSTTTTTTTTGAGGAGGMGAGGMMGAGGAGGGSGGAGGN